MHTQASTHAHAHAHAHAHTHTHTRARAAHDEHVPPHSTPCTRAPKEHNIDARAGKGTA